LVVAGGTSLVIAGTEFVATAGTSFTEAGVEFVTTARTSLVEIGAAAGTLVVSACWLHPHSNKPASALAAMIWIFRNNFIFVIPSN
jgi:hypothetical protein